MKELLIAVDWEVGPYYNEVLNRGGSMPGIDSMVELVLDGLSECEYSEGTKQYRVGMVPDRYTYEEVYEIVAREYYPSLVLLPFPAVLIWSQQELISAYYGGFNSAIDALKHLGNEHLVTIDEVPATVTDAIDILSAMRSSGRYREW